MRRAPRKANDRKVYVGYTLRPSTLELLDEAAKKWELSRSMIIEAGAINEAQRLMHEKK